MTILNTNASLKYLEQIHEFEKKHFDSDLVVNLSSYSHWFESDTFFCHSVISDSEGIPQILGTCTFLLTDLTSYIRLLNGQIKEHELKPVEVNQDNVTTKVLYFSSLICYSATDVKRLIQSAFEEMKQRQITASFAFCVAANKQGKQFALSNQFTATNSYYLNKYLILELNPINSELMHEWPKLLKADYSIFAEN